MSVRGFIGSLLPEVLSVKGKGLFPSVCIAQAALETGWGKKDELGFNKWGIKYKYGRGIMSDTREVEDGVNVFDPRLFQVYDSLQEAVDHYCWLFNEFPKFKDVDRSSVEAFVNSMAPLYATDAPEEIDGDPSYAEKILNIIKREGLEEYDSYATGCS